MITLLKDKLVKYSLSLNQVKLLIITLFILFYSSVYAQDPETTPLYYPYAEWTIEHSGYSGNPFDIIATVTFTHTNSGEEITTEMFYDGDWDWEIGSKGSEDTFKFRFSGTRLGEWTYSTTSDESALDGLTGSIEVVEQSDSMLTRGFIGSNGTKWIWKENGKAFIPNTVMQGYSVPTYNDDISQIDTDITEFINEHGFNGFHIQMAYLWFGTDITNGAHTNLDNSDSPNLSPSPASFQILEQVISKLFETGAMVHFWAWGDASYDLAPTHLSEGINGSVHQRLQRYVAARLGSLPGWTMGAGFDVWEDWTGSQLETWETFYDSKLGWEHIIGARGHQNDDPVTDIMTDQLDYIGHEDHSTLDYDGNNAYDRFVDWLTEYPDKLHFSEDRFRLQSGSGSRDFSENRARHVLWKSAMAGGVASIWGDNPNSSNRSSIFSNKNEYKIFSDFWKNRFTVDLERDNSLTDGYALVTSSNDQLIFYKEGTDSIELNLTGVTVESAIAVDTRAESYNEIDITSNLTSDSQNTWTAPSSSDWVISINDGSSDGSTPPDSPPNIDDVATTETTAEVTYSEVSNADSYEYRIDGGTPVDIGTSNPFEISGLSSGTTYDLQMRSVNSDGVSNWSETTTFTTQEGSQPPENPPSIDEINSGTTSAEVAYSEVSGAESYEYRLDGGTPVDIGTTNPFTIEELSSGTSYDLQMRSVNSDGTSDWSETTTFTTQEGSNPPSNPPAIDEVTTTETTATVSYTGTDNTDSYEYRLDDGDPVDISTSNPFEIENLSSGTSYDLQMRSVNSDGTSDWSSTTTFTTEQESQPPESPPAIDEVSTSQTTATVSYNEFSGAESYEYRIDSGEAVNIGTSNPFTIEELSPGTTYNLQMRSVNSDGSSDWSDPTTITTSSESAEVPDEIILEQNYPNPFNFDTTIKYGIPETGPVLLEVYDLLGKKIEILVGEQQTAGFHEVTFNATNLSSGIYIYQLKANSEIRTEKMLLVK